MTAILLPKGQAALEYAKQGWHVFPVANGTKDKFLAGGWKDVATNDPAQVSEWWTKWPDANIGGNLVKSSCVAVDADTYKPDCEFNAHIAGLPEPNTFTQRSARGGSHYVFTAKPNEEFPAHLCKGVEIKHKGYIMLAPSTFDGGTYEVTNASPPAPCPEWVPRKNVVQSHELLAHTGGQEISDEELTRLVKQKYPDAYAVAGEPWKNDGNDSGQYDWSDRFAFVLKCLCEFSSDEGQIKRAVMGSPMVTQSDAKGRVPRARKAERVWAKEYCIARADGDRARSEWFSNVAAQSSVQIDLSGQIEREIGTRRSLANDAGWFSATALAGKPVQPRSWHTLGVPGCDVSDLGGDGGTGKSLIAQQLAVATVTGKQWLGQNVRQGPAIYLSAEDSTDELHRRLAVMGDLSAMSGLTLRSLAGHDALLAVQQPRSGVLTRTALFDDLEARIGLERPALLVLDTRADLFGGNENDRAQGRQFIGMLRGLAIRYNCAVLLLSHPSVAGIQSGTGTSGTTGWNNSVRSRLYLSRVIHEGKEPNPDARVLTTKKSNYGRIGQQIHLHWRDGMFWPIDMPTLETQNVKAESIFLKLLVELKAQGRRVNASAGAQYAPKVFAEHPDNGGITKTAFKAAMQSLFASQSIISVETGPPSRRRSHIEPAGPFQSPSNPQIPAFQSPSDTPANPGSNPLPIGVSPTPYNPQGSEGPLEGAADHKKEGTSP
ncbi:MAG: AAA family ATPase [Pseudomonadota bacterium]